MKFYRFELAFDGEPQDVGFFQGIDDIGIPIALRQKLYQPFNERLESPMVEADDCSAVVFFFTEQGLAQFAKDIDCIIQVIEPMGWSLLASVMEEPDYDNALYHDQYQAAWSRTYLDISVQYAEIRAVKEINLPSR